MPTVDVLYQNKQIFKELFASIDFALETKDTYYGSEKLHETYFLRVMSEVDLRTNEVYAVITNIDGEIHEKIERFFYTIPPQIVNYDCDVLLFTLEARDLLLSEDWNLYYLDIVCEKITEEFKSIMVKRTDGKLINYFFKVKSIYY